MLKQRRQDTTTNPQTILITGAASGLGLELAKIYLERGDKVWLTDIHAELPIEVERVVSASAAKGAANGAAESAMKGTANRAAESVARGLAKGAAKQATRGSASGWEYLKLDACSDDDWASAAQAVECADGHLDVLISNAGIAVGGFIDKVSLETWHRAMDINILGAVRATRTFLPLMGEGGRIAITASLAGLVHAPMMATYNATKAACVALAETLDSELRVRGISVSAICPQFFQSGLAGSLTGDDEHADAIAKKLLSRTKLTARRVAQRSVKGIDARRTVITPDAMATVTWYSKRFARPLHLKALRDGAKKFAQKR